MEKLFNPSIPESLNLEKVFKDHMLNVMDDRQTY